MASDISTSCGSGLPPDDPDTTSNTMTITTVVSKAQQHESEESNYAEDKKSETVTSTASEGAQSTYVITASSVATTSTSSSAGPSCTTQGGQTKSPIVSKKPQALSPLLRFPLRIGITWKKGERLEAMDFSKTWYSSRIVEIDENEKNVLIHFDGWNSRYDEWFPMASEKLRPQTRHSERKEKKSKNYPQPCTIQDIYHPGQGVLARWTDCKKYPAKINRLMPDGTFEVVFYDGVTRNVQPINIQPLPDSLNQAADAINLPGSSASQLSDSPVGKSTSFKAVQLELPDGVAKRKKAEACVMSLKKITGVEKRNRHMEKSIKKSLAHISGSFKKSPLKAHRLKNLKGSTKKTLKKIGSSPSISSASSSSSTPSPSLSTSSSSSSIAPPLPVPSSSISAPDTNTALHGVSLVSSSTTGDLKMVFKIDQHQFSVTDSTSNQQQAVPSPAGSWNPEEKSTLPQGVKRVKKRCNTDPANYPRKKKKKKSKEAGHVTKSHKSPPRRRGYSLDLGALPTSSFGIVNSTNTPVIPALTSTIPVGSPMAAATPGYLPQPQYFIPSKAFVVEEDHNPFKCQFDGCTKEFRKENLLNSHIKHYHDNQVVTSAQSSSSSCSLSTSSTTMGTGNSVYSSPVNTSTLPSGSQLPSAPSMVPLHLSPSVVSSPHQTPLLSPGSSLTSLPQQPFVPTRRRRRKTGSFCSTDSDVSVSSSRRSSSSKRQRHDSEISVTGSPDILSRDLWADVKLKAPQDLLVEDYGETEEEDVEKDFVNCICQHRETNGLMIQCDVCMCWQHFTCVDSEGTGRPPANYVCLACERPTGIRDSCKYLYDMGWERRGELPTFPFLGETFGKNTDRMKRVATECIPLSSALMGIKAVLHSTRRQIKISKEEEEPEFQLWQTDWDNWTKPEEDLTLTPPRSVEAIPSPAPSTFMFPPAPNSPSMLPLSSANPQIENSPGTENLPPTSSSASSSISMMPTSYQDSFTGWLSTAKGVPLKSSSTSLYSCPTSSTSIQEASQSTSLSSSSSSLANNISSSTNYHPSTEHFNLSSTSVETSTTNLLSASITSQQEICQSNSLTPPSSTATSIHHHKQQHSQLLPVAESELSLPSLSLDTQADQAAQSQGPKQTSLSPQLTPPMNSAQQQGLAATLSQTPSSVRSCSRIPTISLSSSSNQAADGSSGRSDLNLIRGDLFTPGPGGDGPSSLSQPAAHRDALPLGGSESSTTPSTTTGSSEVAITTTSMSKHTGDTAVNVNGDIETSHPNHRDERTVEELAMEKEISRDDTQKDDVGTENLSGERRWQSSVSEQFSQNHHQPLRELFIDVNGGSGGDAEAEGMNNGEDAEDDNDTDTAEESVEPYRDCERNLLVHISRTHSQIECQLEEFEKQIEELEALADQNDSSIRLSGENALNDVPALKKSLGKLNRSLGKIQTLSLYR